MMARTSPLAATPCPQLCGCGRRAGWNWPRCCCRRGLCAPRSGARPPTALWFRQVPRATGAGGRQAGRWRVEARSRTVWWGASSAKGPTALPWASLRPLQTFLPRAGDSKLYLWTPEGASCVHIPLPGFRAAGLTWHPGGESLVLTARDAFCCAFFG